MILFGRFSEYVGHRRRKREGDHRLETALQQVTDPALAHHGLESLLQGLLLRMVSIMGANSGAILLLDPAKQHLVIRKASGIPEERAVGFRINVGEHFAGGATVRNDIYWVRDAEADPTISTPYIKESHIKGMLVAPMLVGDEVIGVVQVDFLVARGFNPQEKRLLEVAAERAALAIQQAKLLDEAQEDHNLLRVIIDTDPTGIVLHSAPDGRLLLFNKAAETIMGRPLAPEVVLADQATFYGICRLSGEPFLPEELPVSRALRGEVCAGMEMLIRQPSGRKVYIMANCAPLRDAKGAIAGAIVSFQDITPIKEQQLLRDEFLSTAAHELKTPVTTIKGYVQSMHGWPLVAHEFRKRQTLDAINAQCDRINHRVQEMLDALRFRTVPPNPRRDCFDLGDLASRVVQRTQDNTPLHRLALHRQALASVCADRERTEEVLVSLLDNALKYSPKGGDIDVRVWAREEDAVVSVKDHGVGIQRSRQPHIFEPFFEAVPSGAPGYLGVATLSLYLSKIIVELHGGHIWFESEEGEGSTFYFSSPLAERVGDGRQG